MEPVLASILLKRWLLELRITLEHHICQIRILPYCMAMIVVSQDIFFNSVSPASSIANLIQKNHVITDIGLDDNLICDASAKMLADALSENPSLTTLKLAGNNVATDNPALKQIQDKLKQNKADAKKKFEEEHPDMVTHKLKKPPPKKKKSSSRDKDGKRRSSSDKDKDRKRSGKDKDGKERGSNGERKNSGSGSGRRSSRSSSDKQKPDKASTENSDAFLAERKKSSDGGIKDKFKGLGLAGLGGKDNVDEATDMKASKSAAFV